jgi:hypothetical protein
MRAPTDEELTFREAFEAWSLFRGFPIPTEYVLLREETPDRCFFVPSRDWLRRYHEASGKGRGRCLRRWRFGIGQHDRLRDFTPRTGARDVRPFWSTQLILQERGPKRGWKKRLREIIAGGGNPENWRVEADVDVFSPSWRNGVIMPVLHLFGDYVAHRARMIAGRPKGYVSPYAVVRAFRRDEIMA